jgi:alpha-mannosidase
MSAIHLVCNAHLDPVWLWEWEEGAAEALATFRTAAAICDEHPALIFNHNEALLYAWIDEYSPELAERISALIAAGQWHVMGGWYLQPDCNLPGGESLVRQVLYGRRYFQQRFGVRPTTAVNLDPFGHSRGLVQILAKSGFDSYLVCRPLPHEMALPDGPFTWVGYDGSTVMAVRPWGHYESGRGEAAVKVERLLTEGPALPCQLLLWGIGNHGGGPSRADAAALDALIAESSGAIRHSTPEAYFQEVRARGEALPSVATDLWPCMPGVYTTQARVKAAHRALESSLWLAERMAALAWWQGVTAYPTEELAEATRGLLFSQFHDALPGTGIARVEAQILRRLAYGQELVDRAKARAFFALAAAQVPAAPAGSIPILVYNPHPYPVQQVVECEISLADVTLAKTFTPIAVTCNGASVLAQVEQHLANHALDWRKRVVLQAELPPASMTRFDCWPQAPLPAKPAPVLEPEDGMLRVTTARLEVAINTATGLVDRYRVDGVDLLAPGACRPIVLRDTPDPWGMGVRRFGGRARPFRLLSPRQAAMAAGQPGTLAPVRVIEDGPVRVVIEALFGWGCSTIRQHYLISRLDSTLALELVVNWQETDRMLKLALPTAVPPEACVGQAVYGVAPLPPNGEEAVAQRWAAAMWSEYALTCLRDGGYGIDATDGLRLTLLRSPAYTAMPFSDRPMLPADRHVPRIDQGEHTVRCVLNGGPRAARLAAIEREAQAWHEAPMALYAFPSGGGEPVAPLMMLDDPAVVLSTVKRAEEGDALIVRLFEPTGTPRATTLTLDSQRIPVTLGAFEIVTLRIERSGQVATVNLLEEPV